MLLKNEILENKKEFVKICRNHNVKYLYGFGSSLTKDLGEKSDIDLMVDIDIQDPLKRGETLLSLWDKLEKFFNRSVDLLTEEGLRNPALKRSINSTRELIYDRSEREISI